MTPLPLLNLPSQQSHPSSPGSHSDRPERSRNAKAQARHRAKRKAYIEQLEQTVVRLQHALASSPDQVASLPPPLRLRELEQENMQLHREVESLRRQLEERNARLRPDLGQRTVDSSPTLDHRPYDHDFRQRRGTFPGEMQASSSTQLASPPTLSMPPMMHNYSHSPHSPSMSNERSSSVSSGTSYGAFSYHMPETPPSSATSSPSTPSFSASPADPYAHYVPRTLASDPSSQQQQQQQQYNGVSPYGIVKVEEDSYASSHDAPPDPNGYTLYSATQPAMHNWGTAYPSRA